MRVRFMKSLFSMVITMLLALTPLWVAAEEAKPVDATTAAAATAQPAPAAEAAKPIPNKGDTAWMLIATVLVILMTIPGLALFYGGMVRSKNMLSILTQVFVIFCVVALLWVIYGYSLAFAETDSSTKAVIGDLSKLFLKGVTPDSTSSTFTAGVVIPEYVFMVFQLTFAAITTALIVGGFAERIKFSALLVFSVLWFTFSYLPMAHMVWGPKGFLLEMGALDFAGGTVVHINAGIAALVGAIVIGKRIGYPKTAMPPHSLTMTMIGACLLWVGWFGFNAGSNLEANGVTALAMVNTVVATAGATLSWLFVEWMIKGKPSLLGGVSGAIAGLVAVTPAAGTAGPMGAIVLGLIAGVLCLWAVTGLKHMFGYDDSLDVFGVHAVGGIVGAIGTGIVTAPSLGGAGAETFVIGDQVVKQLWGVGTAVVWSGVVSFVLFTVIKMVMGLRVSDEAEREGLDVSEHGEKAYNM